LRRTDGGGPRVIHSRGAAFALTPPVQLGCLSTAIDCQAPACARAPLPVRIQHGGGPMAIIVIFVFAVEDQHEAGLDSQDLPGSCIRAVALAHSALLETKIWGGPRFMHQSQNGKRPDAVLGTSSMPFHDRRMAAASPSRHSRDEGVHRRARRLVGHCQRDASAPFYASPRFGGPATTWAVVDWLSREVY
jgi:hypothetical protein